MTRHGSAPAGPLAAGSLALGKSESPSALFTRAVELAMRTLEDAWKTNNLLEQGQSSLMSLAIPVRDLRDWLKVRERLNALAQVRRLDVVTLSRNEVRVSLEYAGGPEQLATALAQADMGLIQEGGNWLLDRRDTEKP